jgi:hypothetical protein
VAHYVFRRPFDTIQQARRPFLAGVAVPAFELFGQSAGASVVYGSLTASAALAGQSEGVGAGYGSLAGNGTLAGQSAGESIAYAPGFSAGALDALVFGVELIWERNGGLQLSAQGLGVSETYGNPSASGAGGQAITYRRICRLGIMVDIAGLSFGDRWSMPAWRGLESQRLSVEVD